MNVPAFFFTNVIKGNYLITKLFIIYLKLEHDKNSCDTLKKNHSPLTTYAISKVTMYKLCFVLNEMKMCVMN